MTRVNKILLLFGAQGPYAIIPKPLLSVAAALAALILLPGCATTQSAQMPPADIVKTMEVTAYCPCKKCCEWHRNWRFKAVTRSGQPKKVGITASGTKAKPGTIAADTSRYPFGTRMYVPGYGYGIVEDRGGAVKGEHIDLFFKSHHDALEWGRVKREVYVWLPATRTARDE